MNYIREFDPWSDPLCTCPPKYTLNPYTGCSLQCQYCYITSYIRDGFSPRLKSNYLKVIERELKRKRNKINCISISFSTDPYQPLEAKYKLTRKTLEMLSEYNIPTLIITKSPMVTRDIDILKNMNVVVSITITTINEYKSRNIEPYAPNPFDRIEAVKFLSKEGLPCVVRIDPIIPGYTDDVNELHQLIREIYKAGAKHIVSSIYKVKQDNFRRMVSKVQYFRRVYKRLYNIKRHGYRHADYNYRFKTLSLLRNLSHKYGLTFVTCREGIRILDDPKVYCDGSHLLNNTLKSSH